MAIIHDIPSEVPQTKPVFPPEVCEFIIEELYEDAFNLLFDQPWQQLLRRTLLDCALVCRAWRPRSQDILLRRVIISSTSTLRRLAFSLKATPHLGKLVLWLDICTPRNPRHKYFGGSESTWYSPQSIIALFPSLLMRRLPNLKRLDLIALFPTDLQWPDCEDIRNPLSVKFLPHLPLPQLYPRMLSNFSTLRQLDLLVIDFASFGEFMRVVNAFSQLETLECRAIGWTVWGVVPPWCLTKGAFLPALKSLSVGDVVR